MRYILHILTRIYAFCFSGAFAVPVSIPATLNAIGTNFDIISPTGDLSAIRVIARQTSSRCGAKSVSLMPLERSSP